GCTALTGFPDEAPIASAIPFPDSASALHLTFAIMAALHHRKDTGRGQRVDLAQYEIGVLAAAESLMRYMNTGKLTERIGNHLRVHAPHNLYPSAPDGHVLGNEDNWVAIAIESDAEWQRLKQVI